jgi:hypothetical protein
VCSCLLHLGLLTTGLLRRNSSLAVHLFIGGIVTATSVVITACVLRDLGQMNCQESKIILGACLALLIGLSDISTQCKVVRHHRSTSKAAQDNRGTSLRRHGGTCLSRLGIADSRLGAAPEILQFDDRLNERVHARLRNHGTGFEIEELPVRQPNLELRRMRRGQRRSRRANYSDFNAANQGLFANLHPDRFARDDDFDPTVPLPAFSGRVVSDRSSFTKSSGCYAGLR